jgi:hypothetical protein
MYNIRKKLSLGKELWLSDYNVLTKWLVEDKMQDNEVNDQSHITSLDIWLN